MYCERILSKGTPLFRYNLGINLPEKWDASFYSPEYIYSSFGPKNQIGALFFYDNEETAHRVLSAANNLKVHAGESYDENTMTSCCLKEAVRLLDISGCITPMQVLRILREEGIDVLNKDFVKHDHGDFSFNELKDDFEFVLTNNDTELFSTEWKAVYDASNRINDFFHQKDVDSRYIGQLLTDFQNGISFKAQLTDKGYDGYCFTEELSPTVCIFDSAKLTAPLHKTIVSQKL